MFRDRKEAGRLLAEKLRRYEEDPNGLILAIPRGGIPVAYEVADRLHLPLDVIVIKKIGFPGNEEFAIGAAGLGGIYINRSITDAYGVSPEYIEAQAEARQQEVRARYRLFRGTDQPAPVEGKNVIVIDDGIATGATVRMALTLLKKQNPHELVVATPVAPPETAAQFEGLADRFICLSQPDIFSAIGQFYVDFSQVDENTARSLLEKQQEKLRQRHSPRAVDIPIAGQATHGILTLPDKPLGLVVFAHGSGSGRFSPRNQSVARELNRHGLGTLLIDLLTEDEEKEDMQTGRLRFDIPFLAERLKQITEWTRTAGETRSLPLGYFGASTGAAAALIAAAEDPASIRAVVSRGGRPDLAGDALEKVRAPVLLIVGGNDSIVIDLNREAASRLNVKKDLQIIPGATHLFEEPGTLDQVAALSAKWFIACFRSTPGNNEAEIR